MFDLRYHVASLAAVFVALLIGILVGVATEREGSTTPRSKRSTSDVAASTPARGCRRAASEPHARAGRRSADVRRATPTRPLIADRLRGKRIALALRRPGRRAASRATSQRALADAGATPPIRMRALKRADRRRRRRASELDSGRRSRQYRATPSSTSSGDELATELVDGGDTPAWNALTPHARRGEGRQLPARRRTASSSCGRSSRSKGPTAVPARGSTRASRDAGVPTVGVETLGARAAPPSSVWREAASRPSTTSTRPPGGSRSPAARRRRRPGSYGVTQETATDRCRRSSRYRRGGWLSPPRSSSPPATRRARSRRRSRRCGERSRRPR